MSHLREFSWDALLHAVIPGTRYCGLAVPHGPRVLHQILCTQVMAKGRENVGRTRRKDFKDRVDRGFHYFSSHPIDHNSVTMFHLTTRNAGKCSLCVSGKNGKRGWVSTSTVSATRTLSSEIKYRMGQCSENRLMILYKRNHWQQRIQPWAKS